MASPNQAGSFGFGRTAGPADEIYDLMLGSQSDGSEISEIDAPLDRYRALVQVNFDTGSGVEETLEIAAIYPKMRV
jgi:hypothetical protein